MLRKFRDEDPDGNGEKDTPVYRSGTYGINYVRNFIRMQPGFYKKDGKWVDGMTEPE